MENQHHVVAGKIHYFDWAMASSSQTVNVYQRVPRFARDFTHSWLMNVDDIITYFTGFDVMDSWRT
jgi:hypothetical protein